MEGVDCVDAEVEERRFGVGRVAAVEIVKGRIGQPRRRGSVRRQGEAIRRAELPGSKAATRVSVAAGKGVSVASTSTKEEKTHFCGPTTTAAPCQ